MGYEYEDASYFDLAQICENGHVINSLARSNPVSNQDHCDRCGAQTVTACSACKSEIRGYHHRPGLVGGGLAYSAPGYCFKCGAPFPWTARAIEAATEMADLLEGLSPEERLDLKRGLPDLMADSPRTPIAESIFKRALKKAGKDGYETMKSILVNVVTAEVRRGLFGVP